MLLQINESQIKTMEDIECFLVVYASCCASRA